MPMNPQLNSQRPLRPHQGDMAVPRLDSDTTVMTLDEHKTKRKQKGLCLTCGEVRTHKPGLWKALMPETVEGLVYKGICLRCNSLDSAKMRLCEPVDGPNRGSMSDQLRKMNDHHPQYARGGDDTDVPGHRRRATDVATTNTIDTDVPSLTRSRRKSFGIERRSVKDIFHPLKTKKLPATTIVEPTTNTANLREGITQNFKERGVLLGQTMAEPDASSNTASEKNDKQWTRNSVSVHEINRSNRSDELTDSLNGESMCVNQNSNLSGPVKKQVKDFRCSDSNGYYGFYTGVVTILYEGTADEEHVPHGRGEMVYDKGNIGKGVWADGLLRLRVPSDRERYEPYLLPHYSIGDVGRKSDMIKATPEAVSKLHVGDCSFIRRSDGTWSYAIVESRSDGADPTITFQVKSGSTKTLLSTQFCAHIRLPGKPDILSGFSVGDPGCDEDMIIESRKEAVQSASKLRVGDGAFVKRSNGSWDYAIVVDRIDGDDVTLKFEVNSRGSIKVIEVSQCGKFVRRVKQPAILTDEKAKEIFKGMKAAERELSY